MRGKGTSASPVGGGGGITPAHAGKRLFICQKGKHTRDHPRTCGEKRHKGSELSNIHGSPPHMRGKGKLYTLMSTYIEDHPRTCGEKITKSNICFGLRGSPPHMRGKAPLKCTVCTSTRITPAHAGKSENMRYYHCMI